MRKLFLSVASLLAATTLFAQRPIKKGQTQLNAGVGISLKL
jgi:hypothetical protein